jgi:BTB/POZ domain
LVGPERQPFTVHREIICSKSPFFQNCLDSGLSESSKGEIELPVDLPAAFEEVLKWVYTGSITSPLKEPDGGDYLIVHNLVHTYILADKLCMESLCNEVVDTIKAWHKNSITNPVFLSHFQDGVLSDSELKKFLVHQLAHDIFAYADVQDEEEVGCLDEESLVKFFEQGGSEAWEVVKRMKELQKHYCGRDVRHLDPSRENSTCAYHRHRDTESCLAGGGEEEKPSEKQKRDPGDDG